MRYDKEFELMKAIERVRLLHRAVPSYRHTRNGDVEYIACIECEETGSDREYPVEYPCPTIKALEGDI